MNDTPRHKRHETMAAFMANMAKAARDRMTTEIGGGTFSHEEIKIIRDELARLDKCEALLLEALPFVEEAEKDPAYKPGIVKALTKRIRQELEKI